MRDGNGVLTAVGQIEASHEGVEQAKPSNMDK